MKFDGLQHTMGPLYRDKFNPDQGTGWVSPKLGKFGQNRCLQFLVFVSLPLT